MLAGAYMPSTGLNKMLFDRVYGSNKALNSSGSSTSTSGSSPDSSPESSHRCHKHSRHGHRSHHHGSRHHHHHRGDGSHSSSGVDRIQQEESLMHLSTHSEGCSHMEDHLPDIEARSPPPHRSTLRRNSSIPENMNLSSPHSKQ